MTQNDLELCNEISKILRVHDDLNRCLRDNKMNVLWAILAQVHDASQKAMYRLMEMK